MDFRDVLISYRYYTVIEFKRQILFKVCLGLSLVDIVLMVLPKKTDNVAITHTKGI